MATTPTKKPIPSEELRDLKFNSGKIDEFVTSLEHFYIDRFGKERYTSEGIRWVAQQAIAAFGYITMDSFQKGAVLTLPNHVLRWALPDGDGEYYRWDGDLPKIVPPNSTPELTGGVMTGAWVGVGDASLRANLGSSEKGFGLSMVALEQGGNTQQAIKYITPEMFGAVSDYDPVTDTGHDDTLALKKAIAVAITLGYRDVRVPSGANYLTTAPLNIGGEGYVGYRGVGIICDGFVNANIHYRVPDNNSACIEILGGSGMPTGRRLQGVTIQPTFPTRYTGVGIRIVGANFSKNSFLWVRQFNVGLHLLNNAAGVFTEQNEFNNIRFHRNLTDVLFETTGTGDDSFHGNDFKSCHFQVKTTVAGDDGNTTPGVALELRGGGERPVYWYNSYCDVHMFGGAGATAIKLTKANTDNIKGNILAEGNLILNSTDAVSSFESKGGFYSIGSVVMSTTSEPTARLSQFVFENRMSNTATFTSPSLAGLTPRQLPLYAADRTDNGCAPFVFRLVGPSSDGLGYGTSGAPGSDHTFGYVPVGRNLQSFVPGLKLSGDGSSFSSYSPTLYISNATVGVQLAPGFFSPRVDNAIDFGSAAYRPKQYWGVNSSINTSDARHKTDPRAPSDAEINAFYEIGQLPWVWQWLIKYQSEGDGARLHSGPTVQAAIDIMETYGLDWRNYSVFCFDKQESQEEETESWDDYYVTVKETRAIYDEHRNCVQEAVPEHRELVLAAGSRVIKEAREAFEVYSFRKEELLLWIIRATIERQKNMELRLAKLENMN